MGVSDRPLRVAARAVTEVLAMRRAAMRVLVSLMMVCLIVGPAGAQEAIRKTKNHDVVKLSTLGKSQGIWTEERRNAARPEDLRLEKPQYSTPHSDKEFDDKRSAQRDPELPMGKFSGDVSLKPLYWAGRLFFVDSDGGDARCSGQFIAPNIILTAAHCVRNSETGEWYGNVRFFLQYDRDEASKEYAANCMWVNKGWVSGGSDRHRYDYALIVTDEPSITGNFGWHANWGSAYGPAVAVGYPGALRKGEIIQYVPGNVFHVPGMPGIVGIQHQTSRFTQGASGGAWIGRFDGGPRLTRANYVISLNSFIHADQPGVMFGPYLDDDFIDLFADANGGCE